MNRDATSSSGISTIIALTMAQTTWGISCPCQKVIRVSHPIRNSPSEPAWVFPSARPAGGGHGSPAPVVKSLDMLTFVPIPRRLPRTVACFGLGVDRHHRRVGVGAFLLAHATDWAVTHTRLEWLDLQVLSANAPAMRLYLRAGFMMVGEMVNMFRIDGRYFTYTTMSKRLREDQHGDA